MIRCIVIKEDTTKRERIEKLIKEVRPHYHVECYSTLTEAANSFLNHKTDFIVLDLPTVPGQAKRALIRKVIEHNANIIVVSALKKVSKAAKELNACDFILKPVTKVRLAQAIEKAMSLHSH